MEEESASGENGGRNGSAGGAKPEQLRFDTVPGSDDITTQIDPVWCKRINSYNYPWKENVAGATITFKKTLRLVGVGCPPGDQVSHVKVTVNRGQTLYWCEHRFQTGHCERFVNYEFVSATERIVIAGETNPTSVILRARDAYRVLIGDPKAEIKTEVPEFEASARRLSAKGGISFASEMHNARVVDVDSITNPSRRTAIFPLNDGRFLLRLFEGVGWRFYGECDIECDTAPPGSTFQPTVTEQLAPEVGTEIKMTWNKRVKRWCFITSECQYARLPLIIRGGGQKLPQTADWLFRGLTLLPFKS